MPRLTVPLLVPSFSAAAEKLAVSPTATNTASRSRSIVADMQHYVVKDICYSPVKQRIVLAKEEDCMRALVPLGRALFAAIFLMAGLGHFSQQSIGYAASQGVPMANVLVPLSGVIALIGGLSILIG